MRPSKWIRRAVSSVALTTIITVPALAQDPDPDSVLVLEPILVRVLPSTIGTRAPYPVSVLTGSQLTRATSSSFIEEAVRAVPGLQIHNRFNFAVGERIAVRGFGPRSQFGVRGIRVLVDGIPATLPDGQATLDHLDLSGLGRVEILRGPNASLYGNAAGGVLHFRTADPAQEPATVSMRWTGGSLGSTSGATSSDEVAHSMWTLQGVATGRSGSAGYRVGFYSTDFDGYRRNPETNDGTPYGAAKRTVVNGTLTLPLGDGLLRMVGNGMDLDAENPGSLPQDVLDEGNRAAWGFNVRSGAFKDVRQGQIGASWIGSLGSLDSEFALWGIRRELFNPIPGRVIDLKRNAGGIRSLFQGQASLNERTKFGWGAGFEIELQRDNRLNFKNKGGDPGDRILDQLEHVTARGLFIQGRLDTVDRLSFLAGLRYDDINFSATDNFLIAGDPDDTGERDMSAFSPSLGAVLSLSENSELFGSIGRSFETPTTTELANRSTGAGGFNPDLSPQLGTTIEGGARTSLGTSLGVELSVFRTDIRDGLVPFEVASDPGRTYFRNSAESHHSGFEVSADAKLSQSVSARLAYTDVRAEYDAFVTGDNDHSGNMIPGLAPHRLDGLLMWEHTRGYVELRGIWQDALPVNDANTSESPAYFISDLRLGSEQLHAGHFMLAPFISIQNLGNKEYNASVVPNAFGRRFFEPGPSRTFRFGMGVTWANR
ncbi:TonB-dependent receptor [Gemmatimonadales bacterium]|nr:TonB-dependent receptor [Gemmatimonadales bacterium]